VTGDLPVQRSRTPELRREVCAVFVTYHPTDAFTECLDRVSRQVSSVVIVDNGSTEAELRMLGGLIRGAGMELIANSENLGIARALNIGVARAVERGFAWALLLDQDSLAAEDMVETLLCIYADFPDPERLAVVGSNFFDPDGPVHQTVAGALHGEGWEEAESVITSGSLLPLAAYALIGPFREELFIDYVDTDYSLRARAMGFRVITSRKQLMSHAIGAPVLHQWLWLKKWTTNHSADRRYYIARNDTVMLREYGNYRAGMWAVKSFFRRMRQFKRIMLYEKKKGSKMLAVAEGWWDGVRGRLGPRRRRSSSMSAVRGPSTRQVIGE
jgi:rhamnosyltransferase